MRKYLQKERSLDFWLYRLDFCGFPLDLFLIRLDFTEIPLDSFPTPLDFQ